MPPKPNLRNQQHQVSFDEEDESATGEMDEPIHTGVSTTTSQEQTFSNLAKMFETYMRSQVEKEKKQDKEKERQEQKLNILTHQITQLQLDMEASRVHQRAPPGPMDPATGAAAAHSC